jgi:hypothetical protein
MLQWLHTHVSIACFICLQTYVANVLSRYFKSRFGIARVVIAPMAGHHFSLFANSLISVKALSNIAPALDLLGRAVEVDGGVGVGSEGSAGV